MNIPEDKLSHISNTYRLTVEKHQEKIEQGEHTPSNLPLSLNDAGDCSTEHAQAAALLGETEEARKAYSAAADFKQRSIQAMQDHWDVIDQELWEDAPALYSQAMYFALVSRDNDLLTAIAQEAIELENSYLEMFAEDYEDSPYRFYHMKVLAALILDHSEVETHLNALKSEVAAITPEAAKQFGETLKEVQFTLYQHLCQDDTEGVVAALDEYMSRHATITPISTDDPDELIDNELIALCLLANDKGIDVTIDSPSVPAVLVPDPATAEYVIDVGSDE